MLLLPDVARERIQRVARVYNLGVWGSVAALTRRLAYELAHEFNTQMKSKCLTDIEWGYVPHPNGHEGTLAVRVQSGHVYTWEYVPGAGGPGASLCVDGEASMYAPGECAFVSGRSLDPNGAPLPPLPPLPTTPPMTDVDWSHVDPFTNWKKGDWKITYHNEPLEAVNRTLEAMNEILKNIRDELTHHNELTHLIGDREVR